jgi:hypothetical protein
VALLRRPTLCVHGVDAPCLALLNAPSRVSSSFSSASFSSFSRFRCQTGLTQSDVQPSDGHIHVRGHAGEARTSPFTRHAGEPSPATAAPT